MSKIIVVTGASSGFGAVTVRALADAGHVVYAGMRDVGGRNQEAASASATYTHEHKVDLRPLQLNVSDDASVDAAIGTIISETGGPRRRRTQRWAHGARTGRGIHAVAAGERLRHERHLDPAREPRCAAAPARAGRRSSRLGRLEQHARRDAAVPRAVLRCEGS